ncbi:hypothetical protein ABRG53_3159 [Pseudanabaena sp. ABRG5-3]|nr:hypothetical protein ABRG53_3159 [Pseudanabaena sp. ABRG5-3]
MISSTIGCKADRSLSSTSSPTPDPQSSSALIGHWRNTEIEFQEPVDSHLVLDANGIVEIWYVRASSQSQTTKGTWRDEGDNIVFQLEGDTISNPFTFYKGQLVFPNTPNQRRFWEEMSN